VRVARARIDDGSRHAASDCIASARPKHQCPCEFVRSACRPRINSRYPARPRHRRQAPRPVQATVRDHELLVGAALQVVEHDGSALPSAPMKSPTENTLDTGNFSVRRNHATAIGPPFARQMRANTPRLLIAAGSTRPVTDAAMFGAFRRRGENIRHAGLAGCRQRGRRG